MINHFCNTSCGRRNVEFLLGVHGSLKTLADSIDSRAGHHALGLRGKSRPTNQCPISPTDRTVRRNHRGVDTGQGARSGCESPCPAATGGFWRRRWQRTSKSAGARGGDIGDQDIANVSNPKGAAALINEVNTNWPVTAIGVEACVHTGAREDDRVVGGACEGDDVFRRARHTNQAGGTTANRMRRGPSLEVHLHPLKRFEHGWFPERRV